MNPVMELPPEIAVAGPEVQAHFRRMVAAGQTERFAAMCALQQPPGTRGTDRAGMEGRLHGNWMDTMPRPYAEKMMREAQAAGISTSGKFFMGGIADKRGHLDPEAWVDSAGDVLRVAKKRDLEVHGIVDYVPPQKPPPKEVDICPTILNEQVAEEMKTNPGLKKGDAIGKVKERIVPEYKRKKK